MVYSGKFRGFTLTPVLIVIGFLLAIAIVILIIINPFKQSAKVNNIKRLSDVNAISGAIVKYKNEHNNELPISLKSVSFDSPCSLSRNGTLGEVSICSDLVPKYLSSLPVDPSVKGGKGVAGKNCDSETWDTGYTLTKSGQDRITVRAPLAELDKVIESK